MAELLAPSSRGGAPVTALDDGAGPPLLLVHGSGGSAGAWDAVLPVLGGFRAVRVRRRRYLPGVDPGFPVAVEAEDLLAIVQLLDRKPLLVGHSSGAVVALEAAVARPGAFVALLPDARTVVLPGQGHVTAPGLLGAAIRAAAGAEGARS